MIKVTETRMMSSIHTDNRTRSCLCLAPPHCEKQIPTSRTSLWVSASTTAFLVSMLGTITIPERHRALHSAILSALSSQAKFSPAEAQGTQHHHVQGGDRLDGGVDGG